MILSLIITVVAIFGIVFILDLTPENVTKDFMEFITPNDTLKEKSENIRGQKASHKLYRRLLTLQTAMETTGKNGTFALLCSLTLVFFAVGASLAVLLGNVWLVPALSCTLAIIPYLYVTNTMETYEKKIREELETVLSIITISYARTYDVLGAVQENLRYIKEPLHGVFQAFLGDAIVSPNIKRAILNMRDKIDDEVFREWCDTLILCQDDRALVDTLQPIVSKLTDIRVVNTELSEDLIAMQMEFWVMVAFVVLNIPLMYFLNYDWYYALLYSSPGKLVLGVCAMVIFVTAMFVFKWTKPIRYDAPGGE